VTVVHGRAGSGKSALLAKITDDIKSSVKNGTTVSLFMRTVGHRRRRRRAQIGSLHALTGSGLRGKGPVRSLLREWSAALARARALALQGISTNAAYEYLAREVAPAERLRAGAEAREHFHEALRKAAEKKAATSSGAGALCVLTHTRIRAPGRALTHAHVRARTHAHMKTRALPRMHMHARTAAQVRADRRRRAGGPRGDLQRVRAEAVRARAPRHLVPTHGRLGVAREEHPRAV
jgi:hypothetical protein